VNTSSKPSSCLEKASIESSFFYDRNKFKVQLAKTFNLKGIILEFMGEHQKAVLSFSQAFKFQEYNISRPKIDL
jgi:hypothetical protein